MKNTLSKDDFVMNRNEPKNDELASNCVDANHRNPQFDKNLR